LALDMASALGDDKNLALYLYYSKKYPESLLRKTLGEVGDTSPQNQKKQRCPII